MQRYRHVLYLLMTAALAGPGQAQVSAPGPAASVRAEEEGEETLELSPFVVNSERDTGYQAQSTLAGNRLNTPIKDLGAAISVFTRDFLDDIGATNTNQLLIYAPNMEAAGPGGNFSAMDGQRTAESSRNEPQGTARTRGLTSPSFTRGYALSGIPGDGFNVQSVTVNRGPNSILFGIGNAAGVVDVTLSQASATKDFNKVAVRYGNNDSLRSTVDFNRVLVEGKLGVRVMALEADERYNQRPAFEKQQRLYGAVTAQPFRSTTIRGNFETGKIRANRPLTVLPLQGWSDQWLNAGRPVYDWTFFDDPARNPSAATQRADFMQPQMIGQGQIFGQTYIPYGDANLNRPTGPAFDSTINSSNNLARNTIRFDQFHPVVNRDLAFDNIAFFETLLNIELPLNQWPGGRAPAGMVPQGFTDTAAFDWIGQLIDETSRQTHDFRAYNLSVQQLAWKDRVGIELNYNAERLKRFTKNSFFSQQNGASIRIDPNVSLPNGQANPNVGRPYAHYGQASWNHLENERENLRATGFLRYDFKDLFPEAGKWIGRHTVTGLWERYRVDGMSYQTQLVTGGVQGQNISSSATNFVRKPYLAVYLGDPIHTGGPLQLQPIRIGELVEGISAPVTYFSAEAGQTTQGQLVSAENPLIRYPSNQGYSAAREVIKSQAAVLQSYWLDDLVVTTVGWRRDESFRETRPFGPSVTPTRVDYTLDEFVFNSTPPAGPAGEIISYGGVVRWPHKWVKLPRWLDVSAFMNDSENFSPAGDRRDPYGNRIDAPKGKTREYGVNLFMFDDKLSVRVNRFETTSVGSSYNPGPVGTITNNIIRQGVQAWAIERNSSPLHNRDADVALMFNALPSGFAEAVQYSRTFDPNAPAPYTTTWVPIPGQTDTRDFKATGVELELVYNPNKQWRFLANVSQQETETSNVAPFTRDLWARIQPLLGTLGPKARLQTGTDYVPGTPLPPGVQSLNDYIALNLAAPLAQLFGEEGRKSDEQAKWRANLVGNFTFAKESRLSGFGVGSGVRWQDRTVIGYPHSYAPNGAILLDYQNPHLADQQTSVDGWVSYTRKIWNDRINWKLQLNVQNLVAEEDLIPIRTQGWGQIAMTRTPPERRWYLTSTFDF